MKDFVRCGSIDDVALGVRWEAGTLAFEVSRRAAVLAQCGVGNPWLRFPTAEVPFFADLIAVWIVGATAVSPRKHSNEP
jgi:hypothetical protein